MSFNIIRHTFSANTFLSKLPFLHTFSFPKMVYDISQGKMSVKKYRRFFYSLPEVANRPEEELIALAKAGLKEEIRQGLEKEEFATLDALFEEAEEVEEGLKETPPSSPRKRRRTSPDHRSSKRGRKSVTKGDPEDEGYGYDGEAATEEEGSERDYWKWMDMETDVEKDDASDNDTDSDCNPVCSGNDSDSDSDTDTDSDSDSDTD